MLKRLVFLGAGLWLAGGLGAQPYGMAERAANTSLIITETPASTPEAHSAQRVFPQIALPGATRVLSVPRAGKLLLVSPAGAYGFDATDLGATDLSPWFLAENGETLVDVVFPKGWTSDADFFVSLIRPAEDVFELVVLPVSGGELGLRGVPLFTHTVSDPSVVSGSLAFDAVGKLLLGLGDGGTPSDASNVGRFPGSVVELDPTGITAPTIRAKGLRQPFLAVDPLMGTVMALDFLPDGALEANRVASGVNFGWPTMLGQSCYPTGTSCSSIGLTRPVYTAALAGAPTFIGGEYSYDRDAPDLHDRLIVANPATREVLVLEDTGASTISGQSLFIFESGELTGIGSDENGVVYTIVDGGLYVMRPADGTPNSFPTRLSDIPALLAAGMGVDQTELGIIPYAPSAILWSDGAIKERFIALPGSSQLGFREQDGWDFPEGGMVIKNFLLPSDERDASHTLRRLETRLLLHLNGVWAGYSYHWNEEETDAILLPRALNRRAPLTQSDGSVLDYSWYYPSRTECFRCHTEAANFVLGINTGQMNHSITYPSSGVIDNQLRAMDHVSLFAEPLPAAPEDLERIPSQYDTTASINDRARAFLHANCSYCHRPGGGGQIGTDFRWSTPLGEMGIYYLRPAGFDLDIEDAYNLLPGHPERSVLAARMISLDPAFRMPPVARSRVATEDLAIVEQWITSLPVATYWSME
ncbi:hypothetical protein GC173_15930 [bacterium]|nr:hypothetical protein [bacterium]